MEPTHMPMGKYYWGIGASLLTLLSSGWLVLSPFALGFQAGNTGSWSAMTMHDFWVGIGLAIVALAGVAAFTLSLVGALRAAGVVSVRPRQRQRQLAPATSSESASSAIADRAGLEQAMATLAAALEADLSERRKAANEYKTESAKIGG